MKHLFTTLSLGKLNEYTIQEAFKAELNKSEINLTFKWTPNRRLVFTKLHLKTPNGISDLLNGQAVNTKAGTHTFFTGQFDDKVDIEISYGIMALVDVPKIVTILTQTSPDVAFQASPKDPSKFNKIGSGDSLLETIKYKVV